MCLHLCWIPLGYWYSIDHRRPYGAKTYREAEAKVQTEGSRDGPSRHHCRHIGPHGQGIADLDNDNDIDIRHLHDRP